MLVAQDDVLGVTIAFDPGVAPQQAGFVLDADGGLGIGWFAHAHAGAYASVPPATAAALCADVVQPTG